MSAVCILSNSNDFLQLIKDEVFTQQTVMLKDYMLAPVFVAIHWLIHYKDTAYEEQRTMVCYCFTCSVLDNNFTLHKLGVSLLMILTTCNSLVKNIK